MRTQVLRKPIALLPFLALFPVAIAQELLRDENGRPLRLLSFDESILETKEARRDLACTVKPEKPALGFDMKFHSAYTVTVPFSDLKSESRLTVIFRVTPESGEPEYFRQRMSTGPIAPEAKGEGGFKGVFLLGEGTYQVDWLMRDIAGRVCTQFWTVKAALPAKESNTALTLAAGKVAAINEDPFFAEPPVQKAGGSTLPVNVLLNFAPTERGAAMFSDQDKDALLSIVRNISRDPNIGKMSLTVFNFENRKVLYHQADADRVDFPALGRAVQSFNSAQIDMKALGAPGPEFLKSLIEENGGSTATIFVGPQGSGGERPGGELAMALKEINSPMFYMNYNPDPQKEPWPDVISKTVQLFRGRRYTIQQPRDLLSAWPDFIARLTAKK